VWFLVQVLGRHRPGQCFPIDVRPVRLSIHLTVCRLPTYIIRMQLSVIDIDLILKFNLIDIDMNGCNYRSLQTITRMVQTNAERPLRVASQWMR